MKKWIVLLIVVALALTMVVTCPTTDKHREAITEIVKESMQNNDNILVSMLGGYIIDAVANEMVSGKNYFLFSTGYIDYDNKKQLASLGLLGHVFVFFDQEDIDKLLEEL